MFVRSKSGMRGRDLVDTWRQFRDTKHPFTICQHLASVIGRNVPDHNRYTRYAAATGIAHRPLQCRVYERGLRPYADGGHQANHDIEKKGSEAEAYHCLN